MTVLNRRPGIASVATLGVLSLAVTAAHLVAPGWSRSAGLDLWNYPTVVADERAAIDRRVDLQATHDRFREQVEAADHIADLVIDGRLPLADAAAEVARINRDRPSFRDSLRCTFLDATTDRRRDAAYVIHKVSMRLSADPVRRDGVVARLRAEYDRLPE
jgi:hypothetical protein